MIFDDPIYTIGYGFELYIEIDFGSAPSGFGIETSGFVPEATFMPVVAEVPEPATVLLLALGGLALRRKRRA